jgi:hypothetical protein
MVTEAFSDFVVGHGELWCAQLFNATLRNLGADSAFMDSRDVLVVAATSDGNSVDVEYGESNARLDRWAQKHGAPSVNTLESNASPSIVIRISSSHAQDGMEASGLHVESRDTSSVNTHWWTVACGNETLELTGA